MKPDAKRLNIFVKIGLCVAVVFCIVGIISYRIEYANQKARQEELQVKIDKYTEEVDELENKLDAPFDDDYIISVAKEKLDYCFPEEVFFIVN